MNVWRRRNPFPSMASLILNDPLVSKRLLHSSINHPLSSRLSAENQFFPLARKTSLQLDSRNGFRIYGSGFGLKTRSCFGSDSNGVFQNQHSSSPPYLESRVEVEKIGKLVNGRQWGCPLQYPHANSAEKIVVAVDVDEVLGNFVSALNRFIADRFSQNHSVSEYHVYEFFKIWNCSRDEADHRVHEFFKSPYFKAGIHPLPGARRALDELSRFCKLSVVTSRQYVIKDHTLEWLEKHFSGLFDEIHFGNHFALHGASRPKSEICRSVGATILIDDNPRYAIDCAEVGIRVLLFDYENSYPWCKVESVDNHPLVTKVRNWEEVQQKLLSWIVPE